MKKMIRNLLIISLFASSVSWAKWVDPDEEARRGHTLKAWQGVDFIFTGVSSSQGMSSVRYRSAVNDYWEWNAGTGISDLGWFLTGGADYFVYNRPHMTCFFYFACQGQVTAGANLYYTTGGRKTYTNSGVESDYDQGSGMYLWPEIGFRSIYRDFFSLGIDVGYRYMVQTPSISPAIGPYVQSNVDDMSKLNNNGLGASISVGIVF